MGDLKIAMYLCGGAVFLFLVMLMGEWVRWRGSKERRQGESFREWLHNQVPDDGFGNQ